MAQVRATARRTITADPEKVLAALADYREVRPAILTEHYRDYQVEAGGEGSGTVVHWVLQATSKRQRDQRVEVSTAPGGGVVETDRNSSMVTTWRVRPEGQAAATVEVDTTWDGAGGVGGFFERLFAPKGLQRIHDGVLANLERRLATTGG
ncbi:SRPBCC family protein [Actinomycetospora sp. TBRC 11914]|uniref:SRPBCC family protein n=1 Tax=Actinomycetospora sp. TBRC 11914 TaxID=2729387 RepID=UPI00145EC4B4|nr:SRPBCC family protein [Actinomycetospora sp. TBRC 11914]NMO93098.1 SRPBCC family protein [Actinomycetospora sp. TBRC 11914]